jgi:hypothetical protein
MMLAASAFLATFWIALPGGAAVAQEAPASADEDARGRPYAPGELVGDDEPGAEPAPEAEVEGIGLQEVSFPKIESNPSDAEREWLLEQAKERLEGAPGVQSVSYTTTTGTELPGDPDRHARLPLLRKMKKNRQNAPISVDRGTQGWNNTGVEKTL